MEYVQRNRYLDYLKRVKDKQIIKVITGVRRCGKSVLMKLYADELLAEGVKDEQLTFINFEDFEFYDLRDSKALYDYIVGRLRPDMMNYVFLDEIQHVSNYADVVDALYIKSNVDLYITGSNAYLLSGEIATLLSGRYVEMKLLPFSLKEYALAQSKEMSPERLYANYITYSSFPYTVHLQDDMQTVNDYLRGIFSTIVLKDVVQRKKVSDPMMLESVLSFLTDNIGNTLSTKKIADTMTSYGRRIDVKTVEKYLSALSESCIVYPVKRYDAKGRGLLKTMEKYYLVDVAFRNMMLGRQGVDYGHVLENVVFLELMRRFPNVYIGKVDSMEVDFVVTDMQKMEYYQVCATMRNPATRERELESLQAIDDHYPKTILTLDTEPVTYHNGIKQQNAIDWLLEIC